MLHTNEKKRRERLEEAESSKQRIQPRQEYFAAAVSDRHTIWGVGTRRADPFNGLPVQGSPDVDAIIKYLFQGCPSEIPFCDDKLVLANRRDSPPNMARTMWQVACAEDVAFMAILHTTSLLRDAARGSGITQECRLWEQRAVQALRQRISSGEPISDAAVASVAALAACEDFIGEYQRSAAHYAGMLALLEERGGIDTFEYWPQRILMWCEFYFRATQMTIPVLYQEPSPETVQEWREALPPDLQQAALSQHRICLSCIPCLDADISGVMLALYHVSLFQDPQWSNGPTRTALSNSLYYAEYKLLKILVKLKEELQVLATPEQIVRSAVAQAAQMFLFAALRDLSLRMASNDLFTARLKATLDLPNTVEVWARAAHVDALVWVSFVGWVMSAEQGEGRMIRTWFETNLLRIMHERRLSEHEFTSMLSQFPWKDEFCRGPCRDLYLRSLSIVNQEPKVVEL